MLKTIVKGRIIDPSSIIQPKEWYNTKPGKKAIFWMYVSNIPPILILATIASFILTIIGIFI